MVWSIIASIAAAASALFSAIAAVLISRQNATHVKLSVENELTTERPQIVYDSIDNYGFAHIRIDNRSSHPITISECFIELDNVKYYALPRQMDCELNISLELKLSKTVKKAFHMHDFTRLPIELNPYQGKDLYLIFPDFKHSTANIINGKICFDCGCKRLKSMNIAIHKAA